MITVVKFGGGVETSGLVCLLHEQGFRPDAVVMADTGGEKPKTYDNVEAVNRLFAAWGWDPVVVVRVMRHGAPYTLEEHSLRLGRMPSVSYGRKSCSIRFKVEPFEKWCNHWPPAVAAWARGERVRLAIGYNVDEVARWSKAPPQGGKFDYWYPLVEAKVGRDEAFDIARRHGLNPCKSACFFCGSARPPEVEALKVDEPELFERGLAIERAARPFRGEILGLGKNFSWESIARQERLPLAAGRSTGIDCECHEGGDE